MLVAEARFRLGLDHVLVVPTGDPYHKEVASGPDAARRLELARAAFRDDPGVTVTAIEVERHGPSHSCDTLEAITTHSPDSRFHFLMGADAALGFGSWHRPERILELARVAVAPRSEIERSRLKTVFGAFGEADRLELFEMPRIDISSSLVRERIGTGEPFRHLVPENVADIIENGGLYGK